MRTALNFFNIKFHQNFNYSFYYLKLTSCCTSGGHNDACILNNTDITRQPFPEESEPYFHIIVYTGIIALVIVLAIGRHMVLFFFTRAASRNLHSAMFAYVIRAKLSFFETNPVGKKNNVK